MPARSQDPLDVYLRYNRYHAVRKLIEAGNLTARQRKKLADHGTMLRQQVEGLRGFIALVEAGAAQAPTVACGHCKQRFYPSRSDAKFCSPRCRQKAHRAQRQQGDEG